MEKRIGVYAMVGPFPTYVGKIEGRTKLGRKPIHRYGEHGTRAWFYTNRFRGRRRRNLQSGNRYGTKPCFPRTLAMAGPHNASMVLLQTTTSREVNLEEHRWAKVLGPCSNAVARYRGPQHIDWGLGGPISNARGGSLGHLAHEIIESPNPKFNAPQLLTILTECKRVLNTLTFEKLFVKIKQTCLRKFGLFIVRLIPINTPSYSPNAIACVLSCAKKLV